MLETEPFDPSVPTDVESVNRAAAARMFSRVKGPSERLTARFIGGTADRHELNIRAATRALLALQESVSAIGATLLGLATLVGKLPASVIAATELRLSPQIAPGSVVFTLNRPTHGEEHIAAIEERPLLDESFDVLLDLIQEINAGHLDPNAVATRVRALGPRAAKHLFDLSGILVDESLGLDFGWNNLAGQHREEVLSNSGARYLKAVAKEGTTKIEEVEFVGTLLTASVERNQKLKIQRADGTKVSLSARPELRENLAPFYTRPVRVYATETLKVSTTTGKETLSYEMRSIELLEADAR